MSTTPMLLDADYRMCLAEQLLAAADQVAVRVWVLGATVCTVRVIGRDLRYVDAPMRWRRLVYELGPEFIVMAGRPVPGRVAELRPRPGGCCVVSRDGRTCMERLQPGPVRIAPANAA